MGPAIAGWGWGGGRRGQRAPREAAGCGGAGLSGAAVGNPKRLPLPRPALARAAPAAPLSPIGYAWDWGSVLLGVLLVRQLGGLPWGHVRLKIVGALFVMSAILLALLRCARGRRWRGVY
jgi:hypothetical protein